MRNILQGFFSTLLVADTTQIDNRLVDAILTAVRSQLEVAVGGVVRQVLAEDYMERQRLKEENEQLRSRLQRQNRELQSQRTKAAKVQSLLTSMSNTD